MPSKKVNIPQLSWAISCSWPDVFDFLFYFFSLKNLYANKHGLGFSSSGTIGVLWKLFFLTQDVIISGVS